MKTPTRPPDIRTGNTSGSKIKTSFGNNGLFSWMRPKASSRSDSGGSAGTTNMKLRHEMSSPAEHVDQNPPDKPTGSLNVPVQRSYNPFDPRFRPADPSIIKAQAVPKESQKVNEMVKKSEIMSRNLNLVKERASQIINRKPESAPKELEKTGLTQPKQVRDENTVVPNSEGLSGDNLDDLYDQRNEKDRGDVFINHKPRIIGQAEKMSPIDYSNAIPIDQAEALLRQSLEEANVCNTTKKMSKVDEAKANHENRAALRAADRHPIPKFYKIQNTKNGTRKPQSIAAYSSSRSSAPESSTKQKRKDITVKTLRPYSRIINSAASVATLSNSPTQPPIRDTTPRTSNERGKSDGGVCPDTITPMARMGLPILQPRIRTDKDPGTFNLYGGAIWDPKSLVPSIHQTSWEQANLSKEELEKKQEKEEKEQRRREERSEIYELHEEATIRQLREQIKRLDKGQNLTAQELIELCRRDKQRQRRLVRKKTRKECGERNVKHNEGSADLENGDDDDDDNDDNESISSDEDETEEQYKARCEAIKAARKQKASQTAVAGTENNYISPALLGNGRTKPKKVSFAKPLATTLVESCVPHQPKFAADLPQLEHTGISQYSSQILSQSNRKYQEPQKSPTPIPGPGIRLDAYPVNHPRLDDYYHTCAKRRRIEQDPQQIPEAPGIEEVSELMPTSDSSSLSSDVLSDTEDGLECDTKFEFSSEVSDGIRKREVYRVEEFHVHFTLTCAASEYPFDKISERVGPYSSIQDAHEEAKHRIDQVKEGLEAYQRAAPERTVESLIRNSGTVGFLIEDEYSAVEASIEKSFSWRIPDNVTLYQVLQRTGVLSGWYSGEIPGVMHISRGCFVKLEAANERAGMIWEGLVESLEEESEVVEAQPCGSADLGRGGSADDPRNHNARSANSPSDESCPAAATTMAIANDNARALAPENVHGSGSANGEDEGEGEVEAEPGLFFRSGIYACHMTLPDKEIAVMHPASSSPPSRLQQQQQASKKPRRQRLAVWVERITVQG